MRPRIKQTFSLQSLGSELLGQLHEMTVLLSNLLIICIQIFPFLGALLWLREERQREEWRQSNNNNNNNNNNTPHSRGEGTAQPLSKLLFSWDQQRQHLKQTSINGSSLCAGLLTLPVLWATVPSPVSPSSSGPQTGPRHLPPHLPRPLLPSHPCWNHHLEEEVRKTQWFVGSLVRYVEYKDRIWWNQSSKHTPPSHFFFLFKANSRCFKLPG